MGEEQRSVRAAIARGLACLLAFVAACQIDNLEILFALVHVTAFTIAGLRYRCVRIGCGNGQIREVLPTDDTL